MNSGNIVPMASGKYKYIIFAHKEVKKWHMPDITLTEGMILMDLKAMEKSGSRRFYEVKMDRGIIEWSSFKKVEKSEIADLIAYCDSYQNSLT